MNEPVRVNIPMIGMVDLHGNAQFMDEYPIMVFKDREPYIPGQAFYDKLDDLSGEHVNDAVSLLLKLAQRAAHPQ